MQKVLRKSYWKIQIFDMHISRLLSKLLFVNGLFLWIRQQLYCLDPNFYDGIIWSRFHKCMDTLYLWIQRHNWVLLCALNIKHNHGKKTYFYSLIWSFLLNLSQVIRLKQWRLQNGNLQNVFRYTCIIFCMNIFDYGQQ